MWFTATFSKPKDPSDFLMTIEAEDKHNVKDLLGEIKVPTLVIGGEDDYFYPICEIAAGIPNAELILYEDLDTTFGLTTVASFRKTY